MGGVGWAHDGVMPDPHLSQPIPAPLLSMASTAEAVAFSVLASALPDAGAAPDGPPEWIKLTPLGKVQGRDGRGPYDFGDAARAAAVVAASNAYAGTVDPLIDYDHAFDLAAARGLGNAPAAGWIKELQARADGIYARVDWTAAGAAKLKSREYRYVSPTFHHAADGTVLRILRAALTNHPNLYLPALASAGTHQEHCMDPTLTALLAALGMPATTDVNGAIARVHGLVATSASARADLDRIATAAGLAAGAAPTAIAAAVSAEPDPKAWVPMATYTAAASALTELQGKTVEQEAVAAIEKAMGEGKVPPVMRDHYLKVYRFDPAGWPAMASVMPVIVPPNKTAGGPNGKPPGKTDDGLDDGEKAVFAMLGVDPAAAAKTKAELGW